MIGLYQSATYRAHRSFVTSTGRKDMCVTLKVGSSVDNIRASHSALNWQLASVMCARNRSGNDVASPIDSGKCFQINFNTLALDF